MKAIFSYILGFIVLCSISFYQSCQQSDHITCVEYNSMTTHAYDITDVNTRQLKDSDEVLARKFAFTFQMILKEALCKNNTSQNIISSAYAIKPANFNDSFIKDSVKELEIYCTSTFNSQYPATYLLNNLFTIPPLNDNYYYTQYITLDAVPAQTDFYTFYIKIKTKENKEFIDTLPIVKLKI